MNAAQEAYDRLMAARRIITPEEREAIERAQARETLQARIRNRLPKVY